PPPGYGMAPPGYGATPPPGYGATPPPGYGMAPQPGYGVTPPPASSIDPGGMARQTTGARIAQDPLDFGGAPRRKTPWAGIAGAAIAAVAGAIAAALLLGRTGMSPSAAAPTEASTAVAV